MTLPDLPYAFGAIFGVVVLLLVAVLNTWASLDGRDNNTISAWVTIRRAVFGAVLPFGLGGVMGHWASRGLMLRDGGPFPELPGGPLPFLAVVALVGAVDALTRGRLSRYPFLLLALAGLPLGAVLWPMRLVAT